MASPAAPDLPVCPRPTSCRGPKWARSGLPETPRLRQRGAHGEMLPGPSMPQQPSSAHLFLSCQVLPPSQGCSAPHPTKKVLTSWPKPCRVPASCPYPLNGQVHPAGHLHQGICDCLGQLDARGLPYTGATSSLCPSRMGNWTECGFWSGVCEGGSQDTPLLLGARRCPEHISGPCQAGQGSWGPSLITYYLNSVPFFPSVRRL